jgi:hypothetical protein
VVVVVVAVVPELALSEPLEVWQDVVTAITAKVTPIVNRVD